VHTEAFWTDPDVQWLAGVNKASDVTYFSKEGFEELSSWLQLPTLIEIAKSRSDAESAIAEVEAMVAMDCYVAQEAGYNLDTYLSAWNVQEDETLDVITLEPADTSLTGTAPLVEAEPEPMHDAGRELI